LKQFYKILFFILVMFLSVLDSNAQFSDSFRSFTNNWKGDTGSFVIVNSQLRSNNLVANSSFYISQAASFSSKFRWTIKANLQFNTSSTNYFDFFLQADSQNLLKTQNGYFVRMGGTADEISLFKLKNGVETKLIDGVNGILNQSNSNYTIDITKINDSFSLERTNFSDNLTVNEGFSKVNETFSVQFFGFRIRQSTASFFTKHFFDDLYVGPIYSDTIPPICDSLLYNDFKSFTCFFNENCDTQSFKQKRNYQLNKQNLVIDSIKILTAKVFEVFLKDSFPINQSFELSLDSIFDLNSNKIAPTSFNKILFQGILPSKHDVLITEMMIDPDPPFGLPNREYVEIKNVSNKFIDLKNCKIKDLTGFKLLPNTILPPDSFLVLYNIPSLNNTEEHIVIENEFGETVHEVNYTDNWYQDLTKKKGGYSLEMIDPSKLCLISENWIASKSQIGGTPGTVNSVNRLLPNDTLAPELINLNIEFDSIWTLKFNEKLDSQSIQNLLLEINGSPVLFKFLIVNFLIGEIKLQVRFFSLKNRKEQVRIFGLKDCAGNIVNLKFDYQWVSNAQRNQIVVNEILFNPRVGGKDFIELYNNSEYVFDLSKLFLANLDNSGTSINYQKISNNILILEPFQYAMISEDTANICSFYNCINSQSLIIQIAKLPSLADDFGSLILLNLADQVLDSIQYSKNWHSAILSNQDGVSLERIDFLGSSNSKNNWFSASVSENYATPGYKNSQQKITQKNTTLFQLESKTFSPDNDGFEDFLSVNYLVPYNDLTISINIYDANGRFVKKLANNELLASEGRILWDGSNFNNARCEMGIYIIEIIGVSASNKKIVKEKMSCVLALPF